MRNQVDFIFKSSKEKQDISSKVYEDILILEKNTIIK